MSHWSKQLRNSNFKNGDHYPELLRVESVSGWQLGLGLAVMLAAMAACVAVL